MNPYCAMMDRPHIIYNRFTRKYVCWMKVMRSDGTQTETVFTADRWIPDKMHLRYDFYSKAFDLRFTGRGDEIPALAQEMGISEEELADIFADASRNTSLSDYVWLPLRFDAEMVYIDWKDEWKLSDYE